MRLASRRTGGGRTRWPPASWTRRGSTITIVGCGAVGREVARSASAMGMVVWGVRRCPAPEESPHVDRWFGSDETDAALGGADVVVNLLPATASTERYFDAVRFTAFKPGAIFVNVGRGSTVDEAALLKALESQHVSWCGLDVTATKPPALDDPLRQHPRVVLTPKSAVFTRRYMDEAMAFFADNLARYCAGQPLRGSCRSQRGGRSADDVGTHACVGEWSVMAADRAAPGGQRRAELVRTLAATGRQPSLPGVHDQLDL